MDISSINTQLLAALDTTTTDELQQIAMQQDSSVNNDNVQSAQLDAFAQSTIQPSNS